MFPRIFNHFTSSHVIFPLRRTDLPVMKGSEITFVLRKGNIRTGFKKTDDGDWRYFFEDFRWEGFKKRGRIPQVREANIRNKQTVKLR